jgi:hypothetical protein
MWWVCNQADALVCAFTGLKSLISRKNHKNITTLHGAFITSRIAATTLVAPEIKQTEYDHV